MTNNWTYPLFGLPQFGSLERFNIGYFAKMRPDPIPSPFAASLVGGLVSG